MPTTITGYDIKSPASVCRRSGLRAFCMVVGMGGPLLSKKTNLPNHKVFLSFLNFAQCVTPWFEQFGIIYHPRNISVYCSLIGRQPVLVWIFWSSYRYEDWLRFSIKAEASFPCDPRAFSFKAHKETDRALVTPRLRTVIFY